MTWNRGSYQGTPSGLPRSAQSRRAFRRWTSAAPKGAFKNSDLAASLKRCPDTNLVFSVGFAVAPLPTSVGKTVSNDCRHKETDL
jgi:hypothetical protein